MVLKMTELKKHERKVNFELTETDGKKVYAYHHKSLKKYMTQFGKNGEIKKIKLTLHVDSFLIMVEQGIYFIVNWPSNI